MTRTAQASPPPPPPPAHPVVRVTQDLFHAAALRLVSQLGLDLDHAASRLVSVAPSYGIDLSLAWATLDADSTGRPRVRQVCLAVPGSGRTAMLFLSDPRPGGEPGEPGEALAERVACVEAACRHLEADRSRVTRLAQSLPEPSERWSIDALLAAGFTGVGNLAYLRRPAADLADPRANEPWPAPMGVVPYDRAGDAAESMLIEALERSYADTLDCPELCGLREVRDVIASHRATGVYDPSLWWLLLDGASPRGCVLLNRCPEQRTLELVYLGLSPELRGRGLAARLLTSALAKARARDPSWTTTCAVDERNEPALRLYRALRFEPFARRTALVRRLAARASP